jgi:protein-tyrosine-phosphatase
MNMPVFADRMKDFTDHLRISIENRSDALGQVHQATNHLLTAARSFMGNVSHEHTVMAGELHESLDKFHGDLADRVEDMRERHRASLKQTQAELRQRLDDNKAARNESVNDMRHTFREVRQEVADDLRAASHAWREFTMNRDTEEPHKPEVAHKAAAMTVEPPAPQHGKKTKQTKENFGTSKPKGRRK